MLKIKNYVKAESLEEAYTLLQKKTSCLIGGMIWLKMSNRKVVTAIDLSGLGLDQIEETQEEFRIGCMVTLHDLEVHEGLEQYTQGALKESLRHIVGIQLRNCATVGGTIYGRYGFSDVLTMFLALDTEVELYHAGRVSLAEYARGGYKRDIVVHLIVKKTPVQVVYLSQRNTQTDFPVLTVCASLRNGQPRTVIGARPSRAKILEDEKQILANYSKMSAKEKEKAAADFSEYVYETVQTESNLRGSAEYRRILARVLTKRAWTSEVLLGRQKDSQVSCE